MKLLFREFTIQTEMFDSIQYLRDFNLIAFIYKPKWDTEGPQRVVLNLCFNSETDAREVFRQYLRGKGVTDELSFRNIVCTWPEELAGRVGAMEKFYLESL